MFQFKFQNIPQLSEPKKFLVESLIADFKERNFIYSKTEL